MANDNTRTFDSLSENYKRMRRALPNKLAIVAVNFFKRNFRAGGFVDRPFVKWKEGGKKSGSTLVHKGNLRRSIQKLHVSHNRIVVGVAGNIPYARIHNEGGEIPITPKMRRYFWAMYKKTGQDRYRNMALTKKTSITIPQRKFIGDSKAVETALEREIIRQFKMLRT